jgi:hypothetical protein
MVSVRMGILIAALTTSSIAVADPSTSVDVPLHIDPRLHVVEVDHEYVRVVDGTVSVSCGRHVVRAGLWRFVIDAPCDGATPEVREALAAALPEEAMQASVPPRRNERLGAVGIVATSARKPAALATSS